ncbi:MAG: hypothetical protein HYX26_09465 [Acidobacteriales bacterium]|nr:hypothetical protein [Terriglobales bacterium]
MRRIILIVFALSLTVTLMAQDQLSSQSTSSDTKKEDKKKDEKKKKDKSKSGGAQDPIDTSKVFNERAANEVLGMIRDGLEGHSRRLMLSAFDGDKMDGYLSFEDQIESYFDHYDPFRVNFRISNVAIDGTKGVVLVDTELEQTPQGGGAPVRKRGQLRFELELGKKGWRVTDVRDRNFFS